MFGKKITLNVPDGQGGTKTVKVSKAQFEQWIREGKISPLITAHVLDPMKGYYTVPWKIGEQISPDQYEKFKDKKGDIFLLVRYEDGEPKVAMASKAIWEQTKRMFG